MATEKPQAGGEPRGRDLPPGRVDFSMMYFTHDAFLRDLRRFADAVASGRGTAPSVRTGWETFKKQLHFHHVAEDEALWPPLRRAVTDPAEIAVLDLMESEHSMIDPMFTRIDAALTAGGRGLGDLVQEMTTALGTHMRHEEDRALPLIEKHLGPAGWDHYTDYSRKTNGLKNGGLYLAWLLDDMPPATEQTVLGLLPPPVRFLYRRVFKPRYARTPRWV
ncbi:hemerythrin domain-containing protein [Streptomyces aidingensis]|uniref:Hemerythrin HHE cation binding domain-containing protein n=1 Tax=Streptomyces aidingensis TaxID=910347 RepID=A0A1I1FEQ9_9ACTN|nr:hemerythrin domain-containing protein [Streptomyces aidingensis]SFB97791.1 Hemerythrin HHE cation binding domain-containing protein [Streptomyces aidingensis]